MVQLYEKGYGKDAAGIAMEAISYGKWKTSGGRCCFGGASCLRLPPHLPSSEPGL